MKDWCRLCRYFTGRPVFIAPGNHDALQQRSVYDLAAWPQNIVIFGSGWQSVPLPDLDCVVHGRGFTEAEEHARLVEGLVVTGAGRHVLVAHGSDESNRPERHDPYRPFLPSRKLAVPVAVPVRSAAPAGVSSCRSGSR